MYAIWCLGLNLWLMDGDCGLMKIRTFSTESEASAFIVGWGDGYEVRKLYGGRD